MITAKKQLEKWILTDGVNKIIVTVYPDYSIEIDRIRVKNELFINQAKIELTKLIQV